MIPGSIPTGGTFFTEIILLFPTKQYKNANPFKRVLHLPFLSQENDIAIAEYIRMDRYIDQNRELIAGYLERIKQRGRSL